MALEIDPDGAETRALLAAARFAGARVLEIGSGDGRLTLRYAGVPDRVVGVEPDRQAVAAAQAGRQPRDRSRVSFVVGSGVRLPFRPAAFDIALFASSL
jgi:ubiquinone/menaquinone biosynthesis C-methylase UbiE